MPPAPRRTPGSGDVIDLWARKKDGTLPKSYGKGKRWRGVYVNVRGGQETAAFDLKREAQDWIKKRQREFTTSGGTVRAEGETPLRVFWEAVVAERDGKATTSAKHASAWSYRVEPEWGRVPVIEITAPRLRRWVKRLRDEGTSAATVITAAKIRQQAATSRSRRCRASGSSSTINTRSDGATTGIGKRSGET